MSKRHSKLIVLTAVLSIINGFAYLFMTSLSLNLLGVRASNFGFLMTRYYGACAIGYGVLLWLIRQVDSPQVIRAGLISIIVLLGGALDPAYPEEVPDYPLSFFSRYLGVPLEPVYRIYPVSYDLYIPLL